MKIDQNKRASFCIHHTKAFNLNALDWERTVDDRSTTTTHTGTTFYLPQPACCTVTCLCLQRPPLREMIMCGVPLWRIALNVIHRPKQSQCTRSCIDSSREGWPKNATTATIFRVQTLTNQYILDRTISGRDLK